jgi:hypothetical protein
MDVGASLIANPKTAVLVQPGNCSLDDPSGFAQPAIFVSPASRKNWHDSAGSQLLAMRFRVVCLVRLNGIWPLYRPANLATNGRNRIHNGKKLRDVMRIGAGDFRD